MRGTLSCDSSAQERPSFGSEHRAHRDAGSPVMHRHECDPPAIPRIRSVQFPEAFFLGLQVWDTAGQEEFNAVTKQYYRNANGCVLAFSTVDRYA